MDAISVIVTAHNAAPFIGEALGSVEESLAGFRRAFTHKDDVCLVVKDLGATSFYSGQTAQELIARFQADPRNPHLEL